MQVQVIEIAVGRQNEKEASSVFYVLDADVAVKWLQSFDAHKMRGGTYKRVEGRRRFNVDLNAKDIAEQLKDDSLYYESTCTACVSHVYRYIQAPLARERH